MKAANPNRFFVCLVVVTVFIIIFSGCDRQSRHKVLTVFFTGVPPLEEEQNAAAAKDKIPQTREKPAAPPPLYEHPLTASRQCSVCHRSTANFNMFGGKEQQPVVDFRKGTVSPGPLVRPRQELCIGCHKDKSAAEALARGLRLHPTSARGDCYACHDPHQSKNPYILLAKPQQICIPCHQDPKLMELAAHKEPGECLGCHNPHMGKDRKLLRKDYKEIRQPASTVLGLPGFPAGRDNLPAGESTLEME